MLTCRQHRRDRHRHQQSTEPDHKVKPLQSQRFPTLFLKNQPRKAHEAFHRSNDARIITISSWGIA
jgi:hypothetical protein